MNKPSPIAAIAAIALIGAGLAGASYFWPKSVPEVTPGASGLQLPEPCYELAFEGDQFISCKIDPNRFRITTALSDAQGKPYGDLAAIKRPAGFLFAMNAGMYHEDKSPVGLYVEHGKELALLNTGDAEGNFFLKPNGVFYVDAEGRPGVLETTAYAAANIRPEFATQSGPMLVIDGSLHPKFELDGVSRHIRNGVGVDKDGDAFFAISKGPVSLGKFARLFKDALRCPNALFFDGAISALHDGNRYIIGGEYPVGPIVTVSRREMETQ